jgi:hypothetical protein
MYGNNGMSSERYGYLAYPPPRDNAAAEAAFPAAPPRHTPKRDLERGERTVRYATADREADCDAAGSLIAVVICLFMLVILFAAVAHPANRMYARYYPNHPPPMYWDPYNSIYT